jgi:hypothetical protein
MFLIDIEKMTVGVVVLVLLLVVSILASLGMGYTVRQKNFKIKDLVKSNSTSSGPLDEARDPRVHMDQRTVARVRSSLMVEIPCRMATSTHECGIVIRSDSETDVISQIRMLRFLGCELQIEVWSRVPMNFNETGVHLVNSSGTVADAVAGCRFARVLVLTNGVQCIVDPTRLLDSEEVTSSGAVFFPSAYRLDLTDTIMEAFDNPMDCEFQPQRNVFVVNRSLSARPMSSLVALADTAAFSECWTGTDNDCTHVRYPCSVVGRYVDGKFSASGFAHRWVDGTYVFVSPCSPLQVKQEPPRTVFPMWEIIQESEPGDFTRILRKNLELSGDSVRTHMATSKLGFYEDAKLDIDCAKNVSFVSRYPVPDERVGL